MSELTPDSSSEAALPVSRTAPATPGWSAFQPMFALCAWVRGFLYANAVVGMLYAALVVLSLAFPATPVDYEDLTHWEWGEACVSFVGFLALVPCGVTFLVFLSRARANVRALDGRPLKQRPIWVVIGWFVPIVNLWKPYQVVRELWDRSACDSRGRAVSGTPAGPVNMWWGLWLASGVIAVAIGPLYPAIAWPSGWTPDGLAIRLLDIAAALLGSSAALVAANVVRDMTIAQHMRCAYLAEIEGAAAVGGTPG